MSRVLLICCGLAIFSVSMQQDLLDMPLAASNYRCSGLSTLETDTGLVSDSSEQLRVFAASGVNPPQQNIYATSTYLPDQNCQFLIAPKSGLVGPDGNRKIKITFSKFELENEVDFLKFYSASSADESKLVSSFTGGVLPDTFEIDGPEVFVTFSTNGFTQLRGFRFLYETPAAQQPIDACSGEKLLLDDYGIISDGASDYTDSALCSWLIKPDWTPESITLSFDTLDSELNYDKVEVFTTDTNQRLFTLSGTVPLPPVNVRAPSVRLQFTSDTTGVKSGFRVSYCLNRPAPAPPPVNPKFQSALYCNQDAVEKLTQVEGLVESGAQGEDYFENMKCEWLLTPQLTAEDVENNARFKGLLVGSVAVQLTIENMAMENDYDFLYVYDGASADPSKLIAALSGFWSAANRPHPPLVANSGSMYLVFSTDKEVHHKGFVASYTVVAAETEASAPTPATMYPTLATAPEPWGNTRPLPSMQTLQAMDAEVPIVVTPTFTLYSSGAGNAVDGDASTCARLNPYGQQWWMTRMTNDDDGLGDFSVHQVNFKQMPNYSEWNKLATPRTITATRATVSIQVGCPSKSIDPNCVCTRVPRTADPVTGAATGPCWALCAVAPQAWGATAAWDFSATCQRTWLGNDFNFGVPTGRWLMIEFENVDMAVPNSLQLCEVQIMGALRAKYLECEASGSCSTQPCVPGWVASDQWLCCVPTWNGRDCLLDGNAAMGYKSLVVDEASSPDADSLAALLPAAIGCVACALAVALMIAGGRYYKSRQRNVNCVTPVAVEQSDQPAVVSHKDAEAKLTQMQQQQQGSIMYAQSEPESWVLETVRAEDA